MPEGWATRLHSSRSMFSSFITLSSIRALLSLPNCPTKIVGAPRRLTATAWFAPLPPGTVVPVEEVSLADTVSPALGSFSSGTITSALMEPTTIIGARARTRTPRASRNNSSDISALIITSRSFALSLLPLLCSS